MRNMNEDPKALIYVIVLTVAIAGLVAIPRYFLSGPTKPLVGHCYVLQIDGLEFTVTELGQFGYRAITPSGRKVYFTFPQVINEVDCFSLKE